MGDKIFNLRKGNNFDINYIYSVAVRFSRKFSKSPCFQYVCNQMI